MTKKNAVMLQDQTDLEIVLNRLTTKTMMQLRNEDGIVNFTDNPSLFFFSNRTIALEIKGCSKNIAEIIEASDLRFNYKGNEVLVWLDDLEERLQKFAESNAQ